MTPLSHVDALSLEFINSESYARKTFYLAHDFGITATTMITLIYVTFNMIKSAVEMHVKWWK